MRRPQPAIDMRGEESVPALALRIGEFLVDLVMALVELAGNLWLKIATDCDQLGLPFGDDGFDLRSLFVGQFEAALEHGACSTNWSYWELKKHTTWARHPASGAAAAGGYRGGRSFSAEAKKPGRRSRKRGCRWQMVVRCAGKPNRGHKLRTTDYGPLASSIR